MAKMNSCGVTMVRRRQSRIRPRILLTGAMRSSWSEVRLTEQDENGFNASGSHLVEALVVGEVKEDVIVHVDAVKG